MPDSKISALPAYTRFLNADLLPIVNTAGAATSAITMAEVMLQLGIYNVVSYGAKGDGTTDDTAAIQAALTAACSAGGGTVFLPKGKYIVSSTLTANKPDVSIVGQGRFSEIRATFAAGDIISFTGSMPAFNQYPELYNNRFEHFSITSSVTRTSGYGIHVKWGSKIVCNDVSVGPKDVTWGPGYFSYSGGTNPPNYDGYVLYAGIWFDACDNSVINNCTVCAIHNGVTLNGPYASGPGKDNDLWVTGGSFFYGNLTSGSVGILIGGSQGGVQIEQTDTGIWDIGCRIDKSVTSITNREIFLHHCWFDSCGTYGIYAVANSVSLLELDGCWAAGTGINAGSAGIAGFPSGVGVNIDTPQSGSAFGLPFILNITGGKFYANMGSGIQMSGGVLNVTGAELSGNGNGTNGGYGIYAGAVGGGVISGCTIWQTGNSTNGSGIYLLSTTDYMNVSGNLVKNAAGTPILNSSSGTHNSIAQNVTG